MEDLLVSENPQVHGASSGAGSSVATGFVLGALVGAGIALLLAPGNGKETRQRLTDAGRRWGGAARHKLDQARDLAHELKEDAKSALDVGRETLERGQQAHEPLTTSTTQSKE
jgi:gas vesicle protein